MKVKEGGRGTRMKRKRKETRSEITGTSELEGKGNKTGKRSKAKKLPTERERDEGRNEYRKREVNSITSRWRFQRYHWGNSLEFRITSPFQSIMSKNLHILLALQCGKLTKKPHKLIKFIG